LHPHHNPVHHQYVISRCPTFPLETKYRFCILAFSAAFPPNNYQQEAQLTLTNPRDASGGQSRSLYVNMDIRCYVWIPIIVLRIVFSIFDL